MYVMVVIIAIVAGIVFDRLLCGKALRSLRNEKNKYFIFFIILEQWLSNKQNGLDMEQYLLKKNYHTVAIYGMGVLGNLLYHELEHSAVTVKYAIDQKAEEMFFGLQVIKDIEQCEDVDAILVTAVWDFKNIKKYIEEKKQIPVVSVEEIVYETAEQ